MNRFKTVAIQQGTVKSLLKNTPELSTNTLQWTSVSLGHKSLVDNDSIFRPLNKGHLFVKDRNKFPNGAWLGEVPLYLVMDQDFT